MKTISLRFSDRFAPEHGTIKAHEEVIKKLGYVWYGKLGNKVSSSVFNSVLKAESPRILLIHSGTVDRYWAYIDKAQHECPPLEEIPEYYRHMADDFKTWFRIQKFEEAPRNIMSQCYVESSGAVLSSASMHSMSPYFIIDAPDD